MASRTITILIKAQDNASAVFGKVNKSLGFMNKSLTGMKGPVGSLAGIAAAGFSIHRAFGFANDSFHAFMDSEKQAAKLSSAMKATGNAAGFTADQLKGFASDLQQVTAFEDDATVGAISLLAAFRNIKGENFKNTIATAMDIAARKGQDLSTVVTTLGKALNDPVRGLGQLRKAGIDVAGGQVALIKSLTEAGETAKAQKIILDELAKSYGGGAAAEAETMAGKIKMMSNAWGDFKENVGGVIASAGLPEWLKGLTERINEVNEGLQGIGSSKAMGILGEGVGGGKGRDEMQRLLKQRKSLESDRAGVAERLAGRNPIFDVFGVNADMGKLRDIDLALQALSQREGLAFIQAKREKAGLAVPKSTVISPEEKRLAAARQNFNPTAVQGPAFNRGPLPAPAIPPGMTLVAPEQAAAFARSTMPRAIREQFMRNNQGMTPEQAAEDAAARAQKKINDERVRNMRITRPAPEAVEATRARNDEVRRQTAALNSMNQHMQRIVTANERTEQTLLRIEKKPIKVTDKRAGG